MEFEKSKSIKRTFSGIPIQLYWQDLYILECVLVDLKVDFIIELGTGTGASARFLSLFAPVITFDNFDRIIRRFKNIEYKVPYDVFNSGTITLITLKITEKKKVFIFCDNGNKPKEFELFAPYIKPGDLIGIHDYGIEIKDIDIDRVVEQENLEPVGSELAEQLNSLIRVFIRR